ncbi:hypothetical protein Noda2021_12070 [Candidatus Dependentiae bacterium Noda2021]|nr:hypothetical protein Noda2021_12070 [Candidatus Dependentiae bacterium Noda2021]
MKRALILILALHASPALCMAPIKPHLVQVNEFFCLFIPQKNLLIPLQKRGWRLQDAPDHLYLSWVRTKKLKSKL